MKNITLIIPLIIVVIISATYIYAYVPIWYYKGIAIKFYAEINETRCHDIINRVPPKYFEGVNVIRFKANHPRYNGLYYWGGTITIFDCNIGTLVHELAHHQQFLKGDMPYEAITHTGRFEYYKELIMNQTEQP